MSSTLHDPEHPFIIWANKARLLGVYDKLTEGMVIGYSKRNGKIHYSLINYTGNASKLVLPPIDKIGPKVFKYNTSLKEVIFDPNITEIGVDAFNNCTNLEYVNMQDTGITIIKKGAFSNCENVREIKLPKGLKVLEETSLALGKEAVFKLPETLEVIMAYALYGCNTGILEIPKSVVLMDYYCINNIYSNLKSVVVKSNELKTEHKVDGKTYKIDLDRFKKANVNLMSVPNADIIVNKSIEEEFKMLNKHKRLANFVNFNKSITFVDM